MNSRALVVFLIAALSCTVSYAQDFFSVLDVRYETGVKRTFVGGPFKGRAFCEMLNQNVWDNVQPVCGNCTKEVQFCAAWSQRNVPYTKVLNGEDTLFVYAVTTKKNRIIFSGASRSVLEAECEETAKNFRANGYQDARCVH